MGRTIWTAGLALAALGLSAAGVAATERVHNMMGLWKGVTHTIVAGQGGHWTNHQGGFDKPGLFERPFTIEVVGQDGRRFWGRSTVEGSSMQNEPFVGALDVDGRRFVLVDTDGAFQGAVMGRNTLSYCYVNVPGPRNPAAIASCSKMMRVRK